MNNVALSKILSIGSFSFLFAMLITPIVTNLLYKYKMWRKTVREKSIDGGDVTNFKKFHAEGEVKTPRMGGLIIWIPPMIVALIFWLLSFTNIPGLNELNFFTRSETWLLFFALITASLVGMIDDIAQIYGKGKYIAGGLALKWRLLAFSLMGLIGGWWCYYKLEFNSIHIPFMGDINVGLLYIPIFIIVMMATYSGGVIDGIDGLAAGSFLTMFGAYGVIAYTNGQIDIAAFCMAILGSLLTYLWFNIPPARFYMGETGIMGLCAALAIVAFFTNSVLYLPIIAFLLVIEAGSVIIQLLSKKFFKKKVFLAAPIHHHFEAIGWPPYKVTMRFWVISIVAAIIGVIFRLLS